MPHNHQPTDDEDTLKKVIVAASIGNIVEWFDFGIYGFLAATLTTLFFPAGDPATALLKTFAVFAVAFAFRPLGGVFFGTLGDRIGRKKTLAITIIVMASATTLMGLLPSYQSAGLLAPALLTLLRCVQGFSAGGEYAGACAYVVEHAPAEKRARYASYLPISTYVAYALAAVTASWLYASLSSEDMVGWGWRIPFIAAGPFGLVGVYLRAKLNETPTFASIEQAAHVSHSPLLGTIRQNGRSMLHLGMFISANSVAFFMFAVYLSTYMQVVGGMTAFTALSVVVLALIFAAMISPAAGYLSDQIGRRNTIKLACTALIVTVYPTYALAATGKPALALLGMCLLSVGVVFCLVCTAALLSEVFPTRSRYTGSAITYNVAYTIFGGTAPFVATYLIAETGSNLSPAHYLICVTVFGFIGGLKLPETSKVSLLEGESLRAAPFGDDLYQTVVTGTHGVTERRRL